MILRHLLLQRSLIFIQGCLQHPKVSVSHNPSKFLFGHEQCRGGPAQHHLAVSTAADLSCPQANSAVRALDHVGRDQATRKARDNPKRFTVNISAKPSRKLAAALGYSRSSH